MNRCKKAREQAGLSVGQAASLMGTTWGNINRLEDPNEELPDWALKEMPFYYCCSVEWLMGEGPDKDYDFVKSLKGSENISEHDRDILAEFAASLTKWKV